MTLMQDKLSGAIRNFLAFLAGYFAMKFKIDLPLETLDALLASGATMVTALVWSWISKSTTPYEKPAKD